MDETSISLSSPCSITKSSNLNSVLHDLSVPIALRKGTCSCTMHPITKYVSFHKLYSTLTSNLFSISLPKTIQEAMDHTKRRMTIMKEMNALKKNGTQEIVELPRDKRIVGCKWVFTIKCEQTEALIGTRKGL